MDAAAVRRSTAGSPSAASACLGAILPIATLNPNAATLNPTSGRTYLAVPGARELLMGYQMVRGRVWGKVSLAAAKKRDGRDIEAMGDSG